MATAHHDGAWVVKLVIAKGVLPLYISAEGFGMYVNEQQVSLVELIRVSVCYRKKLNFKLLIKDELNV